MAISPGGEIAARRGGILIETTGRRNKPVNLANMTPRRPGPPPKAGVFNAEIANARPALFGGRKSVMRASNQ